MSMDEVYFLCMKLYIFIYIRNRTISKRSTKKKIKRCWRGITKQEIKTRDTGSEENTEQRSSPETTAEEEEKAKEEKFTGKTEKETVVTATTREIGEIELNQ